MNNRQLGSQKEVMAADYLKNQGVELLEQNFRCTFGEIDIIGKKDDILIFVEVKYRSSLNKGSPAEAVTKHKQRTICKVADYYRMVSHTGMEYSCRFDVIAILGEELEWIQDAFYYTR